MKISDFIKFLEEERKNRGNVQLVFWAMSGEDAGQYGVLEEKFVDPKKLNVWFGTDRVPGGHDEQA